MEIKVYWTPRARQGLEQVLSYLKENWSSKEISKLERKLFAVLKHIKQQPELFPESSLFSNSRKALIDKNNFIVYRFNTEEHQIEILLFRGTRQRDSLI